MSRMNFTEKENYNFNDLVEIVKILILAGSSPASPARLVP
jgi:hypothetical protein